MNPTVQPWKSCIVIAVDKRMRKKVRICGWSNLDKILIGVTVFRSMLVFSPSKLKYKPDYLQAVAQ